MEKKARMKRIVGREGKRDCKSCGESDSLSESRFVNEIDWEFGSTCKCCN